MREVLIDVAMALGLVVFWGAGTTALTLAAGVLIHPAAGVLVALSIIYATVVLVEVNR